MSGVGEKNACTLHSWPLREPAKQQEEELWKTFTPATSFAKASSGATTKDALTAMRRRSTRTIS